MPDKNKQAELTPKQEIYTISYVIMGLQSYVHVFIDQ